MTALNKLTVLTAVSLFLSAGEAIAGPPKSAEESFSALTACGFPGGEEILKRLQNTVYLVHVRFNEHLANHPPQLVVPKVLEAMAWMIDKDAGNGSTFCEEYKNTRIMADTKYSGDDDFNKQVRIEVFAKPLDRHIRYGVYVVEDWVKKVEARQSGTR